MVLDGFALRGEVSEGVCGRRAALRRLEVRIWPLRFFLFVTLDVAV